MDGNAVIKPGVEIIVAFLKKHMGYMISCRKHVRDMHSKMKKLDDVKLIVEEHKKRNTERRLEVPVHVMRWLEDVGTANTEVESVCNDVGTCFNLRNRYKVGRKALAIIDDIKCIEEQYSRIEWNDDEIPLGRVDKMMASASTPPNANTHSDFSSREQIFIEALKALGFENESHMIALHGMGGVGKTTIMKELKKVVEERNMFTYIVNVVLGKNPDPIAIQQTVADYIGIELKELTKSAKADKLREGFKAKADGGNNKFLVILDDVWQSFDQEDIGLSPLPNQGIHFKVLLTSRKKDVCTEMGVGAKYVLHVGVLHEAEAQRFFRQFLETCNYADPELHTIEEAIVRKCGGLPIAIKTMACTLRTKRKDTWKDALSRLEHHGISSVVQEVFKTSYDNLEEEDTKAIFLMCGLYPEDFDIPTEELVRYGWGLKTFIRMSTTREARSRLNTCIEHLINANLLLESDDGGCVKMHDLVLDFILDMFSKVEHASIVNHGSMSGWHENDKNYSSCKRISLTCNNMSEFPKDLKFPYLSILKLMHGDKSLRFPQDFYGEMEKLQVIAYDKIKYPLLPSSTPCSINLRMLHLHDCSLMFDCSSIGNLLNLEVLSFANSGIEWLPSTIGNLKKLRLLDLTNCYGLRIENGVLRNLVKLEELYMRVVRGKGEAISLTDDNCNEIAKLSKNLSALEFQFFENNAQPKNMSFEKLQRFMISVGSNFNEDVNESKLSSKNRLLLVTNKGEVVESRMNGLFEKTEVFSLSVGDINDIEELVEVKSFSVSHTPQSLSLYNLRVLSVSKCAELRYLFTPGVANTLSKLEHLEVKECDILEELINTRGCEKETIIFPKLKSLSLCGLPKLLGLCGNVNIVDLPELLKLTLEGIPGFTSIYPKNKSETSSLLKEEVVIPKLEELKIDDMKSLEEIWPCEISTSDEIKLRAIEVRNCDNLVTIFPCNPMSLLRHLENLIVNNCGSVEVLFNIDLDSIGEIGEGSSLRMIHVRGLGKLREVWRIKGADNSCLPIRGFQAVKSIFIEKCERFRNVFTPITTNFDLGALMKLGINDSGEKWRNNKSTESCQEQEQTDVISKEEMSQVSDNISNVVFPSCRIHSFHNLHKLVLCNLKGVEVVFEIESSTGRELLTNHHNHQRLLPCLEEVILVYLDSMTHVWKCNWKKFLILQKQHSESPFYNLTTISMDGCQNIKYLFSPLMAKLLSNIKKIKIEDCDGIEEVVSDRGDEDDENTTFTSTSSHTSITLFPHLDSLALSSLPNLKCIGGGHGSAGGENNEISFNNTTTLSVSVDQFKFSEVGGFSWTLCQYPREIEIRKCGALSSLIPCYAAGHMQKLQVLKLYECNGMKEVFESTRGMIRHSKSGSGCDEGSGIPRANNVIMLHNLKILEIIWCGCLEHIFTFSALENLKQLKELTIQSCERMKVVVKKEEEEAEEDREQTTNLKGASSKEVVVFPRLKSITLEDLPDLEGFFLGMNYEFQWPSLEKVKIKDCPKMRVFAPGGSTAPQLKYIHTRLGKYSVEECGLNFHVTTSAHHQLAPFFPSLYPATSEGIHWSFQNVIELHVELNKTNKKIIPSSELLQLQKLEYIYVRWCDNVEEVFEAMEVGTNDDSQTTTLVKLPNLTQVELQSLDSLRYICKSNQWTVFEFPNLTRVDIWICKSLEHVFTSSMVGSLLQLQELRISNCSHMEEIIVKDVNLAAQAEEEESDGKMNEILVLPRLKSLTLYSVPCLKAFCLEKVDFSFPLLDTFIINKCPAITMFTKGNSATPELKEIETGFGSFYVQEDINSFINIKQEEFKRDGPKSWWM